VNTIDYLYVGGRRVGPVSSDLIEVVSPHSEQVVATVPAASAADVDAAVTAASGALVSQEWGALPLAERLAVVARFADVYEKLADDVG
jgi:aldehyde dehydrogenase (NAD+)